MTQKVLFFTAGVTADANELAAIAKLNALAVPAYEVGVRSAISSSNYGAGIESADYVAGTVPDAYDDAETYPVIDEDAPPAPDNLPATQAIVNNGDALEIAVTGSYTDTVTFTVVDGVITAVVLS